MKYYLIKTEVPYQIGINVFVGHTKNDAVFYCNDMVERGCCDSAHVVGEKDTAFTEEEEYSLIFGESANDPWLYV